MLWSGDKAWRQSGERRMLCGLQLPGPNNQQLAFKGKVADVDQSKVWSAGTCLGIDPATNQPTDIPVDCAAPHAMEVTGAVNLAEKFPQALPPEADQDAFIKDACTRMTDAYLAPIQLRSTTLTLIYSTISLPSWSAGSHQVSCSIGATLGNGGWSTLLNSAKGPLLINGQPPIAPPDIPEERLNLPPIPTCQTAGGHLLAVDATAQTDSGQQTQHMPGQQSTGTTAAQTAPTSSVAPRTGQHVPQRATTAAGAPLDGPPPPGRCSRCPGHRRWHHRPVPRPRMVPARLRPAPPLPGPAPAPPPGSAAATAWAARRAAAPARLPLRHRRRAVAAWPCG